MEYTYLGRIGLRVSRLCLGTVNFGGHTSRRRCVARVESGIASRN